VYKYYLGKGIWCIALDRVLTVLRYVFVVVFTIFLTSCIDYRKLWKSVGNNHVGRLEDVLVGQCFSRRPFGLKLMLIIVSAYFGCKTLVHILNIPALIDMYRFYTYLLGVPDTDIQTMPWPEVVRLIAEIKQHHPIMSQRNQPVDDFIGDAAANDPSLRLDAHDIAK
jgi:autophagy-related protein 9